MYNVATLKGLKCPYCGSEKLTVTGTKGALGAAIATGAAFGAIGNMVAGSSAASNTVTEPLQYKCSDCKKKSEALPLTAPMEDVLAAPCTVTFTRESSFVGAVVPQIVYINGVKLGAVKNGKSITFTTGSRHNVIFVTDQYGVAFKSDFRFEAQSGGNISVRFKRKFLDSKNTPADIPANIPANTPVNSPYMAPGMPAMSTQAAQPVMNAREVQPSISAPAPQPAQPVMNAPAPQPVMNTQVAQPNMSIPVPKPFMKVQEVQTSINTPTSQPVINNAIAQPSMITPTAEDTFQPKVRFCTNCGRTLVDEDLFCPYCGAKRFSSQEVSKL